MPHHRHPSRAAASGAALPRAVTLPLAAALTSFVALSSAPALAATDPAELAAIRAQIRDMKTAYEQRIAALEARLAQAEQSATRAERSAQLAETKAEVAVRQAAGAEAESAQAALAAQQSGERPASATAFNPEISLILGGSFTNLSKDPGERRLQGFMPTGGEVMPEGRSFNLGETELVIAANIDPRFRGNFKLAISPENEVGVEEASIQTLGLGGGAKLKAGRFLSGVGYQNELHPHQWDFADASLPYRAFFGNTLGMDGVQARWLAPTPFFLEFGGEAARARSFPSTDSERNKNGLMSGALFAHVGGDLGVENSWRAGLSYFQSKPRDRVWDDPLAEVQNSFSGKSKTWIADFLWKWAPDGNASKQYLKLQGEYFRRTEDGSLVYDLAGTPEEGSWRNTQSGWYAQAVYQFMPRWRLGYRYDRLDSGNAQLGSTLDPANLPLLEAYKPQRNTLMLDWSPSEYSRLRLQLAQDKTRPDATDHQVWLQYIMSLGAHGAHRF